MTVYRSTREEELAYRLNPSVNQSLLKVLASGPEGLSNPEITQTDEFEEYRRDKKQFILGCASETLTMDGKEEYKNRYHVSNLTKMPSDTVMKIVKRAFSMLSSECDISVPDFVLSDEFRRNVYDGMNFEGQEYFSNRKKPTWEEDVRYLTLLKDGLDYWNALRECNGKQELSKQEDDTVTAIAKNWVTLAPTASVFEYNSKVDVYYQLIIYFAYKGVDCKAMLDMVKVNHATRVISPFDLKTTGYKTRNFVRSVKDFRYDIQAAFYLEAILKWMIFMGYDGYSIEPFTFIVESTTSPGIPLLFPCEANVIKLGKYGIPQGNRNIFINSWDHRFRQVDIPVKAIPGFDTLIEDYKYYQDKGFEVHRDVINSNGIIPITFNQLL